MLRAVVADGQLADLDLGNVMAGLAGTEHAIKVKLVVSIFCRKLVERSHLLGVVPRISVKGELRELKLDEFLA